jgi:hypothetical protein
MNEDRNIRILSLGAGVQSSALLLLAIEGQIEPIEHCIFADTGWEPKAVYRHVEYLIPFMKKANIQFHRVSCVRPESTGNIKEDMLREDKPYLSIPFFIKNDEGKSTISRRQCTQEYKISPVLRKTREIMGLKYNQRYAKKYGIATNLMGISTDEIQRMRTHKKPYIFNSYPLIDLGMSRQDCLDWIDERGYKKPSRSACIGCPYHSNAEWLALKENSFEEFMDAVNFEREINKVETSYGKKLFLHKDLIPLDEVDFKRGGEPQLNLFDMECQGMCGV